MESIDPFAWDRLVQALLAVPMTFREGDPELRRIDALSKELKLSEAYALHPGLRKQVSVHGGLGRLWRACHGGPLPKPRPLTRPRDKTDGNVMWQCLLHDLRQMASQDTHLSRMDHDKQFGAHLAHSLKLGERMEKCSDLRRRMQLEGGLCMAPSYPQFPEHGSLECSCIACVSSC